MKKTILTIAIAATALLNAEAQVVIDFNNNALGALGGQNGSLSTGLTGTWTGNATQEVAAGDLTSTYSIAQPGTAQKYVGTATSATATSTAVASLSSNATGTVYFSFLAQLASNADRVGLTLNSGSLNPSGGFNILVLGSPTTPGLYYRNGGTTVGSPVSITGNQLNVQFIVGQIDFQSSGSNDRLQLWLNPDLSGGTLGTANFDNSTTNIGTNLTTIGVYSYGAVLTPGGAIDNIRIDSTLAGVAVIPEPSTLALLGAAIGGMVLLRRRRTPA